MFRVTALATVLTVLLVLICEECQSHPFFGFGSLLESFSEGINNGSSILASLAQTHAQHAIHKLEQFAELLTHGQNITSSALRHH